MSYRPRPRLRVRNCKKRCSVCREIASRFRDVGFTRVWLCAAHYREIENRNSKETNRVNQVPTEAAVPYQEPGAPSGYSPPLLRLGLCDGF